MVRLYPHNCLLIYVHYQYNVYNYLMQRLVEANLKKFITQEEVEPHKIILGVPFYTRVWTTRADEVDSTVVSMKSLENYIPNIIST